MFYGKPAYEPKTKSPKFWMKISEPLLYLFGLMIRYENNNRGKTKLKRVKTQNA